MDSSFSSQIMQESTFGYTYSKIILDERGIPADYIFLDVNPAYERMMCLKHDQIVNKRATEVINDIKEDSFDWIGCFGKVALGGDRTEFEAYSKALNSWFHMSVLSPAPLHFVILSFDITAQKQIELKLEASERTNRLYINNAPDGIFISDNSLRYLDVNPAGCAMLGYTREEILKLSIKDVVPEEANPDWREGISILLSTGRMPQKSGYLRKKDGTMCMVMIDAVLLEDGTNMAFCKDLTEQESLTREKDLYYTAFQSIAQPVVITDAEGNLLSINKALSDLYGYSMDEAVHQNLNDLNPGQTVYENLGVSSEEYKALFTGMWSAIRNPEVRKWEGVVISRRKNGSLVWVNLVVSGIFDENMKLSRVIGFPIDITVSRELENSTRIQLYQTIADLAELRDDDTGNHMKRVGIFAKLLARDCGMSRKYCADIEVFAPMHDIGKVGILDSILRAPRKLTSEEFEVMKTHTILGHDIMKEKKEFAMAADITLYHHEQYNGTGYPSMLSGDAIPLSAQITAVADVYDALRSKRPYKSAWTHEDAVSFILGNSGKQFDPKLIAVFSALAPQFDLVYKELCD